MPSLLSSLEEVITEDYTAVKVNNLLEERIKGYNLGQLYGLRRHTNGAIARLPRCTLRSSNELFLEKLELEIAQRELVLKAHLARKAEEDAKEAKEKEQKVLKAKEKELVIRMHQTYARIAAEKEIRDTEELKMLHEKAQLDMRRVEALQAKSWYYTSALVVAGLGVGLYFLLSFKVALVVDGVCCVLLLALLIKGYLKGESWRMKVVTERMIEDKIEQRSEELVRKLREEYKQRLKDEKAQAQAERAERRRKRLEREERQRGDARRLEQLKSDDLEDGRQRIMLQMLEEQRALKEEKRRREEEEEYERELQEAREGMGTGESAQGGPQMV